jgi:transposase
MADILASKYGYHLPLYRQSQMFENEDIERSGSLLASWAGKCTRLLERVSNAIRDQVLAGKAIFMPSRQIASCCKHAFGVTQSPAG